MTETNKPLIHNKDNIRSQWSQYVRTHARGKCSILCIAVRVKKKTGTKWDRDQPSFDRVAGYNRANKDGAQTSLGARGAIPLPRTKTHRRPSAAVSQYSQASCMYYTRAGNLRPRCSRAGTEREHKDAAASFALAVVNRQEAP